MSSLFLLLIVCASAKAMELEDVTASLNDDDLALDYDTVTRIASLPLHCHSVEYPNKLQQVLNADSDLLPPSGGCFNDDNFNISLLARAPSNILRLL